MYAEYAKDPRMKLNLGIRRRLAPLLDNGRDEIELMTAILFSLPGSPVLYYGDEIAMGDNVFLGDRDGVRTPMQWTGDRNGGFSRADFAQLYAPPLMDPVYGFQAVNVEAQLRTPTSLLRWLHRFIALRKEHPVFGFGTYEPIEPSNPRIFAHLRRFEDDLVAVRAQRRALRAGGRARPLARTRAATRSRCSADSRFPRIGELPYLLTLAPRGFYWFQLEPRSEGEARWLSAARPSSIRQLLDVEALREWVAATSAGTRRSRAHVTAIEVVEASCCARSRCCCWRWSRPGSPPARTSSTSCRSSLRPPAPRRPRRSPPPTTGRLRRAGRARARPRAAAADRRRRGDRRRGRAFASTGGRRPRDARADADGARAMGVEQSNSSVVFDDALVLKVFRKLEPGINPELEMLRFLTARGFPNIAPLHGWYEYEGDCAGRDARRGAAVRRRTRSTAGSSRSSEIADATRTRSSSGSAELGAVTAQMHNVLASDAGRPRVRARGAEPGGAVAADGDDRRGHRADLRAPARRRAGGADRRPRPGRPRAARRCAPRSASAGG